MSCDLVTNKFIRGAAYSKEDEAIILIEANHALFALQAMPVNKAAYIHVSGADFLQQAKIATIMAREVVLHQEKREGALIKFATRQYDLITDAGTCHLTIGAQEAEYFKELCIECVLHIGYPPDDAKRLEDTI